MAKYLEGRLDFKKGDIISLTDGSYLRALQDFSLVDVSDYMCESRFQYDHPVVNVLLRDERVEKVEGNSPEGVGRYLGDFSNKGDRKDFVDLMNKFGISTYCYFPSMDDPLDIFEFVAVLTDSKTHCTRFWFDANNNGRFVRIDMFDSNKVDENLRKHHDLYRGD